MRITLKPYEQLYTQPLSANTEETRNILHSLDLPSIGVSQNKILTAEISREQIIKAINTSKNGKSPRIDGFQVEGYKIFKKDLITILC